MKIVREGQGSRKIARVDIETTPQEAEILLNFFRTLEASASARTLFEKKKSPLNVLKIHELDNKIVLAVLIRR